MFRKYYNRITAVYNRLQQTRTGPWPAAAPAATRPQGIRGYMAAGHHGNTGIGGRGRRQGCTAHNVNELAAHRAAAAQTWQNRVLFPLARNTATGELGRHRAALERSVPLRTGRNSSGTACGFPASRKPGERTADARRGDTRLDTHSTVAVGGGVRCSGHSRSRR